MISVQVLAIAYALTSALLLYLLLATKRSVGFKLLTVALVSALYVGTYLGLRELQGWPINEDLPDRFRLHSAMINEPVKSAKELGTIYLWVQATAPGGQLLGKPRAYHLPYDVKMAEKVQAALRQMEGGQSIQGQMSRKLMGEAAVEAMDRNNRLDTSNVNADADAFQEKEAGLAFTPLQRSSLPPKSTP